MRARVRKNVTEIRKRVSVKRQQRDLQHERLICCSMGDSVLQHERLICGSKRDMYVAVRETRMLHDEEGLVEQAAQEEDKLVVVVDFKQPVRVDCHLLVAHCALYACVCVCVCVCAHARARTCACACVCVLAVCVRALPVCCTKP